MNHRDPSPHRQFVVQGVLLIHDQPRALVQECSATDLAPGEDGKTDLAEWVRQQHATQAGDPAAAWQSVAVTEVDPRSELDEVPPDTG